jgi:hypothetical protein
MRATRFGRALIGFFSVGDVVDIFDRLWAGVPVHLGRPRHQNPATRRNPQRRGGSIS